MEKTECFINKILDKKFKMQYNIKMKNPVKKYMDRLWKPKTHYDPSKYDRVKEKCSHWDLDWLGWDEYIHGKNKPFDKAKTKYTDGDNT
jgi:hypothetical protein